MGLEERGGDSELAAGGQKVSGRFLGFVLRGRVPYYPEVHY